MVFVAFEYNKSLQCQHFHFKNNNVFSGLVDNVIMKICITIHPFLSFFYMVILAFDYNNLAATTLTGMHFVTTTLMTIVLRWLGYIQTSHLPLPDLLKFVLFANFSIVGMNISLMWNSVGFYQVILC